MNKSELRNPRFALLRKAEREYQKDLKIQKEKEVKEQFFPVKKIKFEATELSPKETKTRTRLWLLDRRKGR